MYKFTLRLSVHRGANHDQSIRRLHRCGRSCHGGRDRARNRAISPSSGSGDSCASDRGSPATAPTKPVVSPKKKVAAASGPSIAGKWSGQLTQVGQSTPYKFELAIGPKGAETKYPDLDCTGKLTRVGSSKSYVFFVEIISKGRAEKGGRCPDGTITVARQGDELALAWFGSVQGKTIVAYGTLSKE
ncbi:MAG: hypothetical protein WAU53_00215 [Rhodoplanes sp.]